MSTFVFYIYPYFFRFAIMKIDDIIKAPSSEMGTAHHMPSGPSAIGNSIIAAAWNTSVLENEVIADIAPLPSAVKNPEAKILNPTTR